MKSRKTLYILLLLCVWGCARNVYDVRTERSIFLRTPRGATVYIDVRNTGQAQNFQIEPKIIDILKTKGYKIIPDQKDADIVFRTNIRYSGLAKDANTGTGALSGAAAGGLGGIGAVQGMGGTNYAAGAAAGMVVGALIGYGIEEAIAKSTFVSIIDILIEEKGNPFPHTASYIATLREHGITMQEAVDKMIGQIAVQIANIF